ncbi:fibrinogen-like protein 1 [Pelodytes ibericus]
MRSDRASLRLLSLIIWQLMVPTVSYYENYRSQFAASSLQPGQTPCGEYSSQILPNGRCKITATLPQQDGHPCPDVFRCTDEVSYWLHENEERKQEVLELRDLISELQEELRNHRHRIRILEQQTSNSTMGQRLSDLESWASESSGLQHMQATFIYEIQARVQNLSLLVDSANHSSSRALPSGLKADQGEQQADLELSGGCDLDCSDVYSSGIEWSGIYTITPSTRTTQIEVFCDMLIEGGGWLVIQRRQDGSVHFNRTWEEYKEGFGNLHTEFWLGNENIHLITSQGQYSLRIDLEDWNGNHKYASYQDFRIADEISQYQLHVEGFSGTAEDSFAWYHHQKTFSTPESGNLCAEISHGGWWYHQCYYANLNGVYYSGGKYVKSRRMMGPDGIVWYSWRNSDYYSLKKVSMMIRPRMPRSPPSP